MLFILLGVSSYSVPAPEDYLIYKVFEFEKEILGSVLQEMQALVRTADQERMEVEKSLKELKNSTRILKHLDKVLGDIKAEKWLEDAKAGMKACEDGVVESRKAKKALCVGHFFDFVDKFDQLLTHLLGDMLKTQ